MCERFPKERSTSSTPALELQQSAVWDIVRYIPMPRENPDTRDLCAPGRTQCRSRVVSQRAQSGQASLSRLRRLAIQVEIKPSALPTASRCHPRAARGEQGALRRLPDPRPQEASNEHPKSRSGSRARGTPRRRSDRSLMSAAVKFERAMRRSSAFCTQAPGCSARSFAATEPLTSARRRREEHRRGGRRRS